MAMALGSYLVVSHQLRREHAGPDGRGRSDGRAGRAHLRATEPGHHHGPVRLPKPDRTQARPGLVLVLGRRDRAERRPRRPGLRRHRAAETPPARAVTASWAWPIRTPADDQVFM